MDFKYLQVYFTNKTFSLFDKKLIDKSIPRYNSQLWSIIKQYYFYLYNFKPSLVKYPIDTIFLNEKTLFAFLVLFKSLEVKKTYILDISPLQYYNNKSIKQAVGYKYEPYNHIIFEKKDKENALLLGYIYKYNILKFAEDEFWKYDILTFLINNEILSDKKKVDVIYSYRKIAELNFYLQKLNYPLFNTLEEKIKFINDNRIAIYKQHKAKINKKEKSNAERYVKTYIPIINSIRNSPEFKKFCKEAKPKLIKFNMDKYLEDKPISHKCFKSEVNLFVSKYKTGKATFYR